MKNTNHANQALDQGHGILRLAPNWVPRSLFVPGKRIKLHPDDYYALGGQRGGLDERWLASTTLADNGPLTEEHEGLSQVVFKDGSKEIQMLLRDAVNDLKGELIGQRIWEDYECWPMFSKLFDNMGAIPLHLHQPEAYTQLTGQMSKPEAYFFPPQLNSHGGNFPYTFFGLSPGTTKEEVLRCLSNFTKGDNKIIELSQAYRLEMGTGWDVPPGVLHAPGSLCTYEPQKASDVYSIFQSMFDNTVVGEEHLWKDTPKEWVGDLEFLMQVLDWEGNIDPDLQANRFMPPVPVMPIAEMKAQGFIENWICYKSNSFCAKELTVLPGTELEIKDNGAYGIVMVQGHGKMGVWDIETPTLIRFGQLTHDEYFVSEKAAKEGVKIINPSQTDPIVMLKHFGPGNPDLANM